MNSPDVEKVRFPIRVLSGGMFGQCRRYDCAASSQGGSALLVAVDASDDESAIAHIVSILKTNQVLPNEHRLAPFSRKSNVRTTYIEAEFAL